jgi:hypothetical protein
MKAFFKTIGNTDEIQKAKELLAQHNQKLYTAKDEEERQEIERTKPVIPEPTYKKLPLFFDINDVTFAFLNVNRDIVVSIKGEKFSLNYNKELYNRLEEKFSEK